MPDLIDNEIKCILLVVLILDDNVMKNRVVILITEITIINR